MVEFHFKECLAILSFVFFVLGFFISHLGRLTPFQISVFLMLLYIARVIPEKK